MKWHDAEVSRERTLGSSESTRAGGEPALAEIIISAGEKTYTVGSERRIGIWS